MKIQKVKSTVKFFSQNWIKYWKCRCQLDLLIFSSKLMIKYLFVRYCFIDIYIITKNKKFITCLKKDDFYLLKAC